MRIVEIKDITEEYETARIQRNQKVEYLYDYNYNAAKKSAYYRHISYERLFSMKVVHEHDIIDIVKFGFRKNHIGKVPDIIGGASSYFIIPDFNIRIFNFCRKYYEEIMKGEDIVELIKNDVDEFLPYDDTPYEPVEEEKTKKKTKSLLLKWKSLIQR